MSLKKKTNQPAMFIKTIGKRILENIIIFILKLHPSSNKKKHLKNINKIAVPLFAGIGDAVILTTLLHHLKTIFPDAEIWILETKRTKDVLQDTCPDMHFKTINKPADLLKFKKLFDLFIAPSRNINHYFAAFHLRPKYFIGYNYSLSIKKNESHIIRCNRLLQQLGYNSAGTPTLTLSDHIIEKAKNRIDETEKTDIKFRIGLIVGGRWPSKTYPKKSYIELINRVLHNYENIGFVLLGNDLQPGEQIAKHNQSVDNFSGKISLKETMGIISHTDLIIGPDGGLLNIAIALKKPIIGLFGSVDPKTIVPDHYLGQTLFILQCPFQPCFNEEHAPICRMDRPYCIEIPVDTIMDNFKKMIDQSRIKIY